MKEGVVNLYFARHGQTHMNLTSSLQSYSDEKLSLLTSKGKDQAQTLRTTLGSIPFRHVYSSPLLRALETAAIVAPDKEIMPLNGLRERSFGDLEGKPYKESMQERHHFLSNQIINPHGIETDEQIKKRMLPLLEDIAIAHLGMNALFVTHSGIMRFLLHHFGSIPYEEMENLTISETAYMHIRMYVKGNEKKYEFMSSKGLLQNNAEAQLKFK